ncbi:MAG: hypothetical protein C0514_07375 [Candidatus Puniceispirillum sp.]|nr:hypothetical protein [Candidatus Puniceispirillum sp.]
MKKTFLLLSCVSVPFLLQGCAPVAVVGGASTVMTSAVEERGISGVASDADIKARILVKFSEHDGELFANITVVVHQGRVLLTGTVSTPQKHIAAVRYVWEVKGVKEVMDELKTGQNQGFGDAAKDSWITTRIKSKLLFTNDINSINYNLQTVDGVIYLMGIAKDQKELDQVLNIIRNTSGVKKVVNYTTFAAAKAQEAPIDPAPRVPSPRSAQPQDPQEPLEPVDPIDSAPLDSGDAPSAFDD